MSAHIEPVGVVTREGSLVLADISGYTTFVATTELEHSQLAIALLLDGIIASFQGRLDPTQVEGDAVFFVGDGLDPRLLDWIEDSYVAFHRTARDILARMTCGCRACALVPTLTLKAIAHYGRYFRQRIGPAEHVHGADVILAHRLVKNRIPSHEYVLVTPALAERLPDVQRGRFAWQDEDGVEFGPLRVGYYELGPLRARVADSTSGGSAPRA